MAAAVPVIFSATLKGAVARFALATALSFVAQKIFVKGVEKMSMDMAIEKFGVNSVLNPGQVSSNVYSHINV